MQIIEQCLCIKCPDCGFMRELVDKIRDELDRICDHELNVSLEVFDGTVNNIPFVSFKTVCKRCKNKGKILSPDGETLVHFMKEFMKD